MLDADTSAELNRLYWESDRSVGEIADQLDLSRRALYAGIEPRPAGAPCPECGEGLVYRNRTALENREAECPDCGRPVELEDQRAAPAGDLAGPDVERHWRPVPLPRADSGSGPLLAIALLGGLALGAVVGYLNRSR